MKSREVETEAPAREWTIRLFGDFSLTAPNGVDAILRNQKCEGLIAVLAAHPEGVERDFVAAALWPDKAEEKQRESLRQAIAIVRREAPDLIEASRTHCRLSKRIRYECDLDRKDLRDGSVFMSAQRGEWFEQMRTQEAEAEVEETPAVMSGYLQSLRWCARYDPKSLFAFFNANRALVRGLPMPDILALLDLAGRPEGASGWADYWRGVAEDDLDACVIPLRRALRIAVRERDWELASNSCFELGKVYARLGSSSKAGRIAEAADEVAVRANSASARIDADRLRGTLLMHWGETKRGLELLRRSADRIDDPVRRAVVESTQAWFEAVAGHIASAQRSLELGESLYRETGHHQTLILTSMTRAYISVHEGARSDAIPGLERVASQSYKTGVAQFGVYADESLAKLHLLDRDRALAAAKLNSARLNRLKSRMARTPLEASMIAAIR
ncbi:MAG TPA: hypothetical protein VMI31_09250 [Fimbriimonadaceae bacterium]|nr:hypothetical protein [Fimbriimonadaceae bacterium]